MGYREQLIELMQEWTEDEIDITDKWTEWEEFLTKQGIIKTYEEVYEMDLNYLISTKNYDYWDEENGRWDVERLIIDDNDITKMSNECYFVHNQDFIDESVIDDFYAEQEEKRMQKAIEENITQAYIDLKTSINAFSRFDALLFIFAHNFGKEQIYFATEMSKVRQQLLYCINDVLSLVNDTIYDGSIKLWIPNHNLWSDEEDEHYCELIRFGGYEILSDGKKILNSDVIILKNEENIQTLDYFTYQNIDDFCDYIAEVFEFYKNDCNDVGDRAYSEEINKKINNIIDNFWMNTIEFDYAEFKLNRGE